MQPPRVTVVAPGSAAARAGLRAGDEVVSIDGERPRDVIDWRLLVDEPDLELEVDRGGTRVELTVPKRAGEPLGAEVHSAVFDKVCICDNRCSFCFIHQLPPGLRRSLYVKDDDYRLSFLYGNYTTLTRFTQADLDRVVAQRLSPINVSIHTTDPDLRSRMLRNPKGATSLRWLRALLDHGIAVHGQVVVCPGVNDGDALAATLAGVMDGYPELATLCLVPLGVSRFNRDASLRPHTPGEAAAVLDLVDAWQARFLRAVGRRVAFAADEYYLLADRPFPAADTYRAIHGDIHGDFPMHEDGIGMARAFQLELAGESDGAIGVQPGFFAWVDGAPADGYRAPRAASATPDDNSAQVGLRGTKRAESSPVPVGILTGEYGARVLEPLVEGLLEGLVAGLGRPDVRVIPVPNRYFGGNIAVTGLLVGEDLAATLAAEPHGHRYLLPDVCLSNDRFLDGLSPADLPRPVEVVATDGLALRAALGL